MASPGKSWMIVPTGYCLPRSGALGEGDAPRRGRPRRLVSRMLRTRAQFCRHSKSLACATKSRRRRRHRSRRHPRSRRPGRAARPGSRDEWRVDGRTHTCGLHRLLLPSCLARSSTRACARGTRHVCGLPSDPGAVANVANPPADSEESRNGNRLHHRRRAHAARQGQEGRQGRDRAPAGAPRAGPERPEAHRRRPERRRGRGRGLRAADRRAGRVHRPPGGARRRLAERRHRRVA